MSVNRQCKNSFHRRNDSGELDVFEASRYFSSANDSSLFSPNFVGEKRLQGHRAARMSLDMPMMKNIPINSDNIPMKESKKCKQPSSPGGRLASFLNSLFNQTASKKKKKTTKPSAADLDHEEIHGGRKRRSSISHFRITSSDSETVSKSIYAKTPMKLSYKELERLSDQKVRGNEEFRFSNGDVVKINGEIMKNCDGDEEEDRGFRKLSDVDDGADSDSSSDLFDLPNYDLDLPVYGTTNMDRIRIAAPISSVAAV